MLFLDTTLRDGEQTPGVSLNPEKKVEIAIKLDELGVDVIEAGFAAVSKGEMEAVKRISSLGLRSKICSMARVLIKDIDAVLKSGATHINLVVPTSDIHLKYKLKRPREYVLKLVEEAVGYAKDHGLYVELSAEDATRSDMGFLCEVFRKGVECGADRLCPCDTVGIMTPERIYNFFSELKKEFEDVPLSAHCHDDLGLATANTLFAVMGGADEVHVTVNGLGERAGNAALEEVAVLFKAVYGLEMNLKTQLLYETSRIVSRLTGVLVQPNKAIVGENAFTHESGIHTHGVLAYAMTYEPIPPEMVGFKRRITVGKHAGTHGIKAILESWGLKPTEEQVKEIFRRVKELGDKGKKVTDANLLSIAETVMNLPKEKRITLKELTVVCGNRVTPTASLRLEIDGKEVIEASTGVGPVDAAINAMRKAVDSIEPIKLEKYSVEAIEGGTDAVVQVSVLLEKDGKRASAMAANEDIVMASVEALLSGLNVLLSNYSNFERNDEGKDF
ncbi:2-isopropylmalate synthase [Candidatus Bathyarchaeota archaeon B24-2]|nr:MAG: 2-isopropylmalate synthase [Candidatus Bathyarchaeota archaeon B24-2]